ncbi:MAG: tetratricopeptide repeat protein, partial [Chloroflexota bacterium]
MSDQIITVDEKLFVGRVEEQKQFRAALAEVLEPPQKEDLPYVCLLYGDGGAGKTTLAKRFRDIVQQEPPYAGNFQVLWIDWEDERKKFPSLQVGRQQISPESVFKAIHAVAIRNKWGRQFAAYRKALQKREDAAKQVAQAITADNDWDELAILRSLSVDALAKIVRAKLPMIGNAGEDIVEAFLDAGIKVGADQAAKLGTAIEHQLRAQLKSDYFDYFLNPYEQLAMALARGLNRVAKSQKLLVVLDSYEIVDQVDIWTRAVTRAAGPNIVWVISGRNDLLESRQFGNEYFKGYADDSPRRLLAYQMRPLAIEDIRTYFEASAPERELPQRELEELSRVTRGVPLAVKEAADIWKTGAPLAKITGETAEFATGQLVQRMTDRYLQHVVAEADRQAIFALSLADGDVELLRAMLRPEDGASFDLEELLRRLERDYASVHANRARLHDDPAVFIREYLQDNVRRTSQRIKGLNQRAVEALRLRLATIEEELQTLEERCTDNDWVQTALSLSHYLFWIDEAEAWHWIIPRCVEGMAYSPDLRNGLLEVVDDWKALSESTERLYHLLRSPEEAGSLLKVLDKLEDRGWLNGQFDQERKAILELHRGNHLLRHGQLKAALERYGRVETGLPEQGDMLRSQLADAYELLAHRLLWPSDRYQTVPNAAVEQVLRRVLDWYPERHNAWYLLGANLSASGQNEAAIESLQKAIELNERFAAAHSALGNVYVALGRHEEAQAAYDKALAVDPSSSRGHGGLGAVYQAMGNPEQAIAAYEKAIENDTRYVDARIGLGQMYLAAGEYDRSLAILSEAETLAPGRPAVHNAMGDAYVSAGQPEAAIVSFQKAVEIEPAHAPTYSGMGRAYRALGQPETAIAAYQRAVELAPGDGEPFAGLGDLHADASRYD